MTGPFLAWLLLFVALFVAMSFLRATDIFLGPSVSLLDVTRIILLLLPHFAQQALPIAFLLCVLVAFGRLRDDGELRAMQSVGANPWRLAIWPWALGAALSVVAFAATSTIEPWSITRVLETANDVLKRNVLGSVQAGRFYDELPDLTLFADEVDPTTLAWKRVLLFDGREHTQPSIVLASTAQVQTRTDDDAVTLALGRGVAHRMEPGGYTTIDFERGELNLALSGALGAKHRLKKPNDEWTPFELYQAAEQADAVQEPSQRHWVQFHARVAQCVAPLAFAAIACPLALGLRRASRRSAFVATVAGYAAYYALARLGVSLGNSGVWPLFSGHLANVTFLLGGMLALWALARTRGVT